MGNSADTRLRATVGAMLLERRAHFHRRHRLRAYFPGAFQKYPEPHDMELRKA